MTRSKPSATFSKKHSSSVSGLMDHHFTAVAPAYRDVRTTDPEPVDAICRHLDSKAPVRVADIGTGTGRYAELLRAQLPRGSRVVALDRCEAMLHGLLDRARDPDDLHPTLAGADRLPLRPRSLDAVTTFNAVHHFDLGAFLSEIARVLRPGGTAFVYTRTPEQNARTIWGQYFPEFAAHETRLHTESALRRAVEAADGLSVVETKGFEFPRRSTSDRLRQLAEAHHYSTFCFYDAGEFDVALASFLDRLPRSSVTWTDENLLVVAQRVPDRDGRVSISNN